MKIYILLGEYVLYSNAKKDILLLQVQVSSKEASSCSKEKLLFSLKTPTRGEGGLYQAVSLLQEGYPKSI